MTKFLVRYFVLVNIATFIVRGLDKWKAYKQKRRVKEKTLLILSGIGGWVGGVLGMEVFRHKTVKGKFLIWFRGIVIAWIIIIIFLLINASK